MDNQKFPTSVIIFFAVIVGLVVFFTLPKPKEPQPTKSVEQSKKDSRKQVSKADSIIHLLKEHPEHVKKEDLNDPEVREFLRNYPNQD